MKPAMPDKQPHDHFPLADDPFHQFQLAQELSPSDTIPGESSLRAGLVTALAQGQNSYETNPLVIQALLKEVDHWRAVANSRRLPGVETTERVPPEMFSSSKAAALAEPDYWYRSIRGVARDYVREFGLLNQDRLEEVNQVLSSGGPTLSDLKEGIEKALALQKAPITSEAVSLLKNAVRAMNLRVSDVPEYTLRWLDQDPQEFSQLSLLARSGEDSIQKHDLAISSSK